MLILEYYYKYYKLTFNQRCSQMKLANLKKEERKKEVLMMIKIKKEVKEKKNDLICSATNL